MISIYNAATLFYLVSLCSTVGFIEKTIGTLLANSSLSSYITYLRFMIVFLFLKLALLTLY